jgi:peptidoglycan hydrolase CwlO-like protein
LAARADIDKAQSEVDKLTIAIAAMRQTVQAERDRDAQNLRNAQSAVTGAQAKVNSLQNDINTNNNWIRIRQGEIASWNRWYNNLVWYDTAVGGPGTDTCAGAETVRQCES